MSRKSGALGAEKETEIVFAIKINNMYDLHNIFYFYSVSDGNSEMGIDKKITVCYHGVTVGERHTRRPGKYQ